MARTLALELEDEVAERVERRAAREGRTLEEEVRRIVKDAARDEVRPSREQVLAELEALRAMTPPGPRKPAEELIREIRDAG